MSELTQEKLKEILSYDPKTGIFLNKISRSNRIKKGQAAGSRHSAGYLTIGINNKEYYCHRLAWLYIYGGFPITHIDHINEIKTDNRICNLRIATHQENMQNVLSLRSDNKTGYKGVYIDKRTNKFLTQIAINGKTKHLGSFTTAKEAYLAYLKAKKELHVFWREGHEKPLYDLFIEHQR
jgi:hypothetical protein